MKYFLIFVLSVDNCIALTFEGCKDVFHTHSVFSYSYCDLNNFSLDKVENQGLTLCITPKSRNNYLEIYSLTNKQTVAKYHNSISNSRYKLTFTVKKIRFTRDNYRFEIKFRNEIRKIEQPFESLKEQRTRFLFHGDWEVSLNFFTINATHSTNCEDERLPTTFSGCFENGHHSNCCFHNFYPLKIGKTRSLKICFRPEPSFKFVMFSILNPNFTVHKYIKQLGAEDFKIHALNEGLLTMTKTDAKILQTKFQNSTFELSTKDLQQERILHIFFAGRWNGSRSFSSENGRDFTNCAPGRKEPLPTLFTPYIPVVVTLSLLTIGVTCLAVTILHCRTKRKEPAGAAAIEIPNQEVQEVTDSSKGREVSDVPCYINVGIAKEFRDESEKEEKSDVMYAAMDFGVTTSKNGKPKKTEKKAKNVEIKASNIEKEATLYVTLLLEESLNKETIQYVNHDEYAMDRRNIKDNDDEVRYANISDEQ